jgi:RNA polymerase sigma-70 factor (ECF subfamily)
MRHHDEVTRWLVKRARGGCRRAFARLWAEHEGGVRRVAQRSSGSQLAEDVVQDVAVAALAGVASLRGDERAFAPWLRAIAQNRARTASWARRRRHERSASQAVESLAVVLPGLDAVERRELRQALMALPRCYRLPLRLHYLRGLSGPEIAARLGMTHGSVRVCLCRGLHRLRHRLGVRGPVRGR